MNEWLDATDLDKGNWLQTSAGTRVQITAVERATVLDATVHNLTVAGVHTYYVVADFVPILVHNCDEAFLDNEGEVYVRSKHTESGANRNDTKGYFSDEEDLFQLAEDSNKVDPVLQDNGNCARICNAGRPVGFEAPSDGGAPTSVYTVITDKYGAVITMHPGVPR
ncbi:HINT domain-containing protein [Streptomyces albidoflavus]|nr:HINT domain-containing protein [Streptomyces albidoflavus]MBV7710352.1 HINT domain-containing protein [Streptomyces albidoflavus]